MQVYSLCSISQLRHKKSMGVKVAGHSLIVIITDEQIYVYINQCPHLGLELNMQPDGFLSSDENHIQCANHGALFDLHNGQCVWGPCVGQKLPSLVPFIENDHVCVELSPL